jgi:hypothetical protein
MNYPQVSEKEKFDEREQAAQRFDAICKALPFAIPYEGRAMHPCQSWRLWFRPCLPSSTRYMMDPDLCR